MTAPFALANALDTIPIVQSTTDRNTKYPNPVVGQRVENLQTGVVERFSGTTWLSPDPVFDVGGSGGGTGGSGSSFPLAGQPGILGTGYFAVVDTTAHRNALNPAAFTVVFNLQTGNIEGWNGSQWEPIVAGVGNFGTTISGGAPVPYAAGRANVPWFNVSTYGATGNGTNDDTQAFQQAVSAATALPTGGVVFVPPGKYVIAGTIPWSPNVSFFAVPGSAVIIPFASGFFAFDSPTGGIAGACFMYGLTFDSTQGSSASGAIGGIVINSFAAGGSAVIDSCTFNFAQASGQGAAVAAVGANPTLLVRNCTVVGSNGSGFITGGPVVNCTVSATGSGIGIQGSGLIANNVLGTPAGGTINGKAIVILASGSTVTGNTIWFANGHGISNGVTGLFDIRVTENTIRNISGTVLTNGINITDASMTEHLTIADNDVFLTDGSSIFVSVQSCAGVTIRGNNTRSANAASNSLPAVGANASIEVQGGVNVSIVGNNHWFDGANGDHAQWQIYLGSSVPVNVSIIGNTAFASGAYSNQIKQINIGSALAVEESGNIFTTIGNSSAPFASGTLTNTGITGQIFVGGSVTITASTSFAGYVPVTGVNAPGTLTHQLPEVIRVNATSANVTVTLPVANTCVGANLTIKRIDSSSNTVTVAQETSPADTIDGSTSNKTIAALGSLRLFGSGPTSGAANWDVL